MNRPLDAERPREKILSCRGPNLHWRLFYPTILVGTIVVQRLFYLTRYLTCQLSEKEL